jgi:hypothetical protein
LLEVFDQEVTEIEEDEGHRFILAAVKAGVIGAEMTINVAILDTTLPKIPSRWSSSILSF